MTATEIADANAPWMPDLTPEGGPKYRAIADALIRDVRAGRLKPGDKLPPQRDLAWRLGVTLGTVTRAYQEAERRGTVAGEVGRGTFVLDASRQPASGRQVGLYGTAPDPGTPWAVGDAAMEDTLEGPEAGPIPLQSNVPPPGREVAALRSVLAEMATAPGIGDLLAYQPKNATARFRKAGVDWLARRGLDCAVDDVALSAGAHNGLMATLATITKPGQRLLTEAFSYPGIKTITKLLSLDLVAGAIDSEGLTVEAVAEALEHGTADAIYCVPTLQNPTNAIMSDARRREIARLCERHEVPLIEDDLCGLFPENAPPPLTTYMPRFGYYVTSLSKTLAPGLRIGFVKTPPRMRDHVAASVRASTWMASPITAEIATRWIADGTADAVLAERRASLARRRAMAMARFDDLSYVMPEGALHLWLTLPEQWRASQFVAAAAADDVILTAAHAFTVGTQPSPGAVRVCLGPPRADSRLEEGLDRLRRILDEADPIADSEVM